MADEEKVLRSLKATNSAFLRFINSTERKVDVVWMNYQGQHVKFKTLLPGTFFDANTYESHPWLFIDADTRDRLVVKSKDVYLPEPWFKQYERIPIPIAALPMRIERTKVYITIPVFPLRQRALQIVRDMLQRPEDAFKLEIPTTLQKQLARMVRDCSQTRLNCNPP
ncbi:von Hippel-Lindau disease tumor suppressor [Schistocerca nitens]|uniref:von Hippel-Lindau disease tumor suppressor n=1 Tax=Schistocerca nitens TaxID=7011 RepID=UPI00211750FC|nr:von Hippel-Lindau disease tumor suppressor [Schistocerca nitens]XP_049788909.1 von Hippel-Lindau disease tumor suppressor [Schistocerca nitens]